MSPDIAHAIERSLIFALIFGVAWRSVDALGSFFISRFVTGAAIFGAAFTMIYSSSLHYPFDRILERVTTWVIACAMLSIGASIGAKIDDHFKTAAHARAARASVRLWFPRKP
jgi:hypothetical protein